MILTAEQEARCLELAETSPAPSTWIIGSVRTAMLEGMKRMREMAVQACDGIANEAIDEYDRSRCNEAYRTAAQYVESCADAIRKLGSET